MADYKKIENLLRGAVENKNKLRLNQERAEMMNTIGSDIVKSLRPLLGEIAHKSFIPNSDGMKNKDIESIKNAIREGLRTGLQDIKIPEPNITIESPEVIVPDIIIPPIKVPVVNYTPPSIHIPDIVMPDEMNIRGWVQLQGVSLDNPLPVQLRDKDGNPVNLLENLTTLIGGGGGGGARIMKIGGINDSAWGTLITPDGRLKTEAAGSGGGLTDTELRASAVPVIQVTGSVNSVNMLQTAGNATVVGSGYQDNALRVVNATDAVTSVYANNPFGQGDAATALRVVIAGNSDASVAATQVGTWNIATVTTVTGVTNSVAASIIDSGGIGYSGSNPLPITGNVNVNGALNSVLATGVTLQDASDDGDAPVKIGGIAIIANPTAMSAGGDRVSARFDDIGRILTRPVHVRDLLRTAYVTEDEIQEVTLLVGVASEFHDLVYVLAANESSAAINLDFRQTTGGTIQMSLEVPATGTAGVSLSVPIPQDHADATWTVRNSASDNSNTVYSVTALFSREV